MTPSKNLLGLSICSKFHHTAGFWSLVTNVKARLFDFVSFIVKKSFFVKYFKVSKFVMISKCKRALVKNQIVKLVYKCIRLMSYNCNFYSIEFVPTTGCNLVLNEIFFSNFQIVAYYDSNSFISLWWVKKWQVEKMHGRRLDFRNPESYICSY